MTIKMNLATYRQGRRRQHEDVFGGKSFAKKGATYLENDANVLAAVVIEGKPEEAKKLLDAIMGK